jgi:transketolase
MTDHISSFTSARRLRELIVKLAYSAGNKAAHIGGALSCIDFISVVDNAFSLDNPVALSSLVLSKGHACLALYALMIKNGICSFEEISSTIEDDGSKFLGHPCRDTSLGISFSTGSLGNGLAHAVGVALHRKSISSDVPVFCILGDGECNEGIIWESFEFISRMRLSNMYIFIDCNAWQQTQESLYLEDSYTSFYNRIRSYDFNSFMIDGHDHSAIKSTLVDSLLPTVIVAKTIKGKGVSFLEGNNDSHHMVLTNEAFDSALSEVKL